jgi:hypothetical protein
VGPDTAQPADAPQPPDLTAPPVAPPAGAAAGAATLALDADDVGGGSPRPFQASAGLAAFLGWLVPGLGHFVVGRRGKAFLYFGVIVGAYVLGLALADWRCVHYERYQVWFFAQVFAGLPTGVTALLTRDLEITRAVPLLDVGQLYVGVASLLNAIAVADAIGCAQENADLLEDRALAARERRELEAALRDVEPAPSAREPSTMVHPASALEDEWPPPPAPPANGTSIDVPPGPPPPAGSPGEDAR